MSPRENICEKEEEYIHQLITSVLENVEQNVLHIPAFQIGEMEQLEFLSDDEEENIFTDEEEESQMEQVEPLSDSDLDDLEMYRQMAEVLSFEEIIETPTTSNNFIFSGVFTVRRRLFSSDDDLSD